ncbi:plasmid recombination protein [Massilia timonae]|uniref:plasmid recombination protein n=1 Tax=Massilia timonae TaxID=47229 RepID=UPI00161E700A|nr:plasmid recombination protein [Massilia timonae]
MSDFPVMIKKLKGQGIVRIAAKHNLREIAAEIGAAGHIDAARIRLNLVLRGPASADIVARNAKALMADAGITRPRATAVMALELVFTLPADTHVDVYAYFEDATRWAEKFYQVPLLSSVLHLDESTPHCHVLLLPLVEGHMVGSDLYGDRAKLKEVQATFHAQVRARYGMTRQIPAKCHSAAVRAKAMQLAYKCLDENSGLADDVLVALLKPHAKNPEPLLLALGHSMPTRAACQSFVAMMTRPTKPEQNPIGKESENLIGKSQQPAPKIMYPYPCVGKELIEPASSDTEQHEMGMTEPTSFSTLSRRKETSRRATSTADLPATDGENRTDDCISDTDQADEPLERYTRERDSERFANEWNSEVGEWSKPGYSTGSRRQIAAALVREALCAIRPDQRPPEAPQEKRRCSPPLCEQGDKAGVG